MPQYFDRKTVVELNMEPQFSIGKWWQVLVLGFRVVLAMIFQSECSGCEKYAKNSGCTCLICGPEFSWGFKLLINLCSITVGLCRSNNIWQFRRWRRGDDDVSLRRNFKRRCAVSSDDVAERNWRVTLQQNRFCWRHRTLLLWWCRADKWWRRWIGKFDWTNWSLQNSRYLSTDGLG